MAISTVVVSNTDSTLFLSTGDSAVTFLSLCNTVGSTIIITGLYIIPNGGVKGDDNLLLKNIEIITDDTFILYHGGEKILLENGDSIVAVSNTFESATAITSYTAM